MDGSGDGKWRGLPQVQKLLELPAAQTLIDSFGRTPVLAALRTVLDTVRAQLRHAAAAPPNPADILDRAAAQLAQARSPRLRRVINATGIVLHTNLGRAPLAAEAVAAITAIARGYCNLELDLATGARGSRTHGVEPLLCQLTGAEAALAVNNCAAAVLLALSGLAAGGEVIVSRGELVEIGGGFRIPDVIQQGGARLVEVGATNKTRLADYAAAITPTTQLLLKVHQSNFRITGFTESTPASALASLAHAHGLLLVHDLGSGDVAGGLDITTQEAVAAGADVVAFSGDKLLGGPQSGLLVGRKAAIDRLRRHPLLRAVRLDKLTLAALEATLRLHCDGASATVPALRKLRQTAPVLRARAERLAALLGPAAQIEATTGLAGGGTLPGHPIQSVGVCLAVPMPDQVAARLRQGAPAVVARIANGLLLFDMLTLEDAEIAEIAIAVAQALQPDD